MTVPWRPRVLREYSFIADGARSHLRDSLAHLTCKVTPYPASAAG